MDREKLITDASELAGVPFSRRVLLLPHCLRPSLDCPGRMTKEGLDCGDCDRTDCAIHQLRTTAMEAGYAGVCVAPGGRLAVRYLAEHEPGGVVAVACDQELEEGLAAVDQRTWNGSKPIVTVIPLLQDGCVDTVVDVPKAREVILTPNGCTPGEE